jgi:uncharacterized membrane protein
LLFAIRHSHLAITVATRQKFSLHIQRNLIAGILTIIPILVVWVVLDFVFAFLFSVGSPIGRGLIRIIADRMPESAPLLTSDIFEWLVAVILALLLIYGIGAAASRVIGLKLIAAFEALVARIPFVQSIYSGSKKLVAALRHKPDNVSRVVLIDFPSAPTKAVGLVMRTFTDAGTGVETAMVYVPTAFNPTAGFLEFVPVANMTSLDMTMDQAMAMVVSGGAVSPDRISTQPPPSTP